MGVCFLAVYGPLAAVLESFRPAALALVACLYFVTNTVLVSGVLSLLQGKPLREVCQEWYVWSFPYYLIGAALVGLLPFSGQSLPPEASLVLMPLLYLMHFYYGLSKELPEDGTDPANKPNGELDRLSTSAKLYLGAVITAGSGLLAWSLLDWEWKDPMQFLVYLAVVQMASTCKVRLPRITGTISVNFVVLLAAIAELSLPEVVALSAVAALVQCLWKPKVRPKPIQIPFSVGTMVLSSAFAFTICRLVLDGLLADSLASFFVLATTLLYAGNTILISTAWGLAEGAAAHRLAAMLLLVFPLLSCRGGFRCFDRRNEPRGGLAALVACPAAHGFGLCVLPASRRTSGGAGLTLGEDKLRPGPAKSGNALNLSHRGRRSAPGRYRSVAGLLLG